MLKRSMVILMVVLLLLSFSASIVFAEDITNDKKDNIQVNFEDGEDDIYFLDAVPEHAKDNPSPGQHPSNPIRVAGN